MPTPFMHLEVAEEIRKNSNLSETIAKQLASEWPAFYLGSVAADFQTISDVTREATHFYKLPPQPGVKAHEVMLEQYPELAEPRAMEPAHAVFIAAYRAHLLLDLRWYWDVLIPFFVEADGWPGDHRQRFLAHNTLLTYLDKIAFESLPGDAACTLAAAEPDQWLPFTSDGDLVRWRDLLVQQMKPGASLQTVAIYAERMQMTTEAFTERLEDRIWLEEQLFSLVPLERVQGVISEAREQSVSLITDYLKPKG